jgi:hypothetical protein
MLSRRLGTFVSIALFTLAVAIPFNGAQSFERQAILLRFKPQEDSSERYMFQLQMNGAHISPGAKDEMAPGEFAIGTVYKDTVMQALNEQTHHRITYYTYNVRQLQDAFGSRDRNNPNFGGGNPFPNVPPPSDDGGGGGGEGGGGGDGGGGGGPSPEPTPTGSGAGVGLVQPYNGGFIGSLGLPGSPAPGVPTQAGPPGGGGDDGGGRDNPPGGGRAGERTQSTVNLDTIKVTNLDYITDSDGNVLDVGGLDLLRKVSQNQLINSETKKNYIDIDIGHVFEWTHLLRLPNTPVYKEDIWFHEIPIHIPGLPYDKPIMTKFMYKLVDFRTVGNRKVAVIDMSGVTEWNVEWDNTGAGVLTEFKSWGNTGFSARYWFDYEANTLFAATRPAFMDWQYGRGYGAGFPFFVPYDGEFAMTFPGLVITSEFHYNTRETDVSGKPRLVEVKPNEQRRYIVMNMFCQLEAE